MIYATLFLTFAKIALCTLGGGSAAIPFLMGLPEKYGWVTAEELAGIIAVGESAPGPGGVNMSSYIGFEAAGIGGVVSAVAGLCLPSIVIMTAIAACLHGVQDHPVIKQFFYGLRPAVVAAIAVAVVGLMQLTMVQDKTLSFRAIAIYIVGMIVTHLPQLKRIHLFFWILMAGIAGVILGM